MYETSSTASALTRIGGTVGAGLLCLAGPAQAPSETPAVDWGCEPDARYPVVFLAGTHVSTVAQVTRVRVVYQHEARLPRTPLGERLLALRAQAIAKGMRLLTWEEISEEVKLRRGERSDAD